MLTPLGQRSKTDKYDAHRSAQCLRYGGYHSDYIPTGEDDTVKEYLRMRGDHKPALKKLKQQINVFVLFMDISISGRNGLLSMLPGIGACRAFQFR